jgi:branched-chain amino acid transport system permease protein
VALLELDAVEKRFGGLPAVDGVSLRADDGEILAIVGPNGAGKSTLLKLIVGIETPTRGSISIDGSEISGEPAHQIRRRGIAMVQQNPRRFPSMTVVENVALGALFGVPGARHDEEGALQTSSHLLDFIGLTERAGDEVDSLNLHQQRLVELARALAGRPRLLLLDEVMAGLNDAELEDSVGMVRRVRDQFGITIVWVEHVMKAVMQLAERVIVLDFGKVLTEGEPAQVMRNPAVVAAYLGQEMDIA